MKANVCARLREDEGVTDVLGTILMVGITVSMMVGLGILLLSFEGPGAKLYADLQFDIEPGDLSWGDGNERVALRHLGGEPIQTDDAKIVVTINGTVQEFSGSDLDQGFSDGVFAIGDTWVNESLVIAATADVEVALIDTGLNQVVGNNRFTADLSLASSTPPITTYVQDYYIVGGNGAVSDFPNAQTASDAGQAAHLEEASNPGGYATSGHRSPDDVDDSQGVAGPDNVLIDDQTYTKMADANDYVAVDGFTVPADLLTIDEVRIGFEARHSGGGSKNPIVEVRSSTGGSGSHTVASAYDTDYSTTITGDKIVWLPSDISNMIVTVERTSSSSGGFKDADIDHVWIEIDYWQVDQWDMDIMFNFTGIPSGTIHEVQVRYDAPNDDYDVQVWNGAAWNVRGQLTADTNSLFTYRLNVPSEYNGGEPRIRFVDKDLQGGQGELNIDYARVQTV